MIWISRLYVTTSSRTKYSQTKPAGLKWSYTEESNEWETYWVNMRNLTVYFDPVAILNIFVNSRACTIRTISLAIRLLEGTDVVDSFLKRFHDLYVSIC